MVTYNEKILKLIKAENKYSWIKPMDVSKIKNKKRLIDFLEKGKGDNIQFKFRVVYEEDKTWTGCGFNPTGVEFNYEPTMRFVFTGEWKYIK